MHNLPESKKWLDDNNISYESRNIKEENPTAEEIKKLWAISGLPLKKFFNTSGLLYKSMNLKEKLNSMTDDEKIEILSQNGMLIKRPLLIGDNFALPGFKEDKYRSLLLD